MGANESAEHPSPAKKADRVSAFYLACRNGEVETVQKMLPNLTYEQINQIEPNGSTALHAASYYNHPDIVQLLLARGCSRTTVNGYRATAYQEAANDRVRALFDRPTLTRFVEEHPTNSFKLLTKIGDDVGEKDAVPNQWLKDHRSVGTVQEAKSMIVMANSPSPFQKVVRNRTEADITNKLRETISGVVPKESKDYQTIGSLLEHQLQKMITGNLLTAYTLESPVYNALQTTVDSFTVLLYFHLLELKDRAYQGRTYRAAKMRQTDIDAYRWALQKEGYVVESRTFQSTSLNKSVIQRSIALQDASDEYLSVLFILDFLDKCLTAINLTKISEELPALSAYEGEVEILVLPLTLFSVKEIKTDSESGQYRITLANVPTPTSLLLDTIK